MRVKKAKTQRRRRSPTLLERIKLNAAGIDCEEPEKAPPRRPCRRDVDAESGLSNLAADLLCPRAFQHLTDRFEPCIALRRPQARHQPTSLIVLVPRVDQDG
jgi:hypothetical protein